MKKKLKKCINSNCYGVPHSGGRCVRHAEQKKREEDSYNLALNTLHSKSYGFKIPENNKEFFEIQKLFWDACSILNSPKMYKKGLGIISPEEAECALDWCVRITELIIDEINTGLDRTFDKKIYLDRFENLKKGLRSNGTPKQ